MDGGVSLRELGKDLVYDCISAAIQAVAIQYFILPGEIALGGVPGAAQIIRHLTGLPVGMMTVLINLPLLILSWFCLGKSTTLKTIKTVCIFSIGVDVVGRAVLVPYAGDRLLASIFGGLIIGAGQSLIFLRNSTGGGGDIVAKVIQKKHPQIKTGKAIMAVNLSVMLVYAMVLRQLETVLYGVICMFCMSQALDAVLYGLGKGTMLTVVTGKGDMLSAAMVKVLNRGATTCKVVGAYSNTPYTAVVCVIKDRQFAEARKLINSVDPDAFMIVSDTKGVYGKGFMNDF